jgi:hypothetical protein
VPVGPRRRARVAGGLLLAGVLLATSCSDDADDGSAIPTTEPTETTEASRAVTERTPTVEPGSLEGPITVGRPSFPANPRPLDLDAVGYTEEEWFVSGTATAFEPVGELGDDGRWDVEPAESAPYATRMVVRRPADPDRFSGTVVVEWLNVTAVEVSPGYAYVSDVIVDEGAAYVGVSVQAFGIIGGQSLIDTGDPEQGAAGGGIRGNNPERYGSLEHPGDRFAFDIWSQVGAALRSTGDADLFGGAEVRRVVAAGQSQSAGFLTTYVNAVHPVADVYDGFFVHSRRAVAPLLDGVFLGGSETAVRIRDDLDVPVLVFQTETDVGPLLQYALARQEDGPWLRVWEVAGTAHADAYLVGREFGLCDTPINDGPQHYVAKAALDALLRWIDTGEAPPQGDPIETGGPDGLTVERDERGLALGGIRTPSVDVPVSALSGEAPEGTEILCALFGSSTPFDDATLTELYGSRDEYLERFDAALDDAVAAGFVRPVDRDAFAEEAREVAFPG